MPAITALLSPQPHRWLKQGAVGLGDENPVAESTEPLGSSHPSSAPPANTLSLDEPLQILPVLLQVGLVSPQLPPLCPRGRGSLCEENNTTKKHDEDAPEVAVPSPRGRGPDLPCSCCRPRAALPGGASALGRERKRAELSARTASAAPLRSHKPLQNISPIRASGPVTASC